MNSSKFLASIDLRYRPEEIDVPSDAPFANDKLGREPFVAAVTELISSIDEPFVIALNAPWGSGKTTTLRMLEASLNQISVTAVSFNAWEIDDATDPLIPLVATLHDRLLSIQGFDVDHAKVNELKKLGSAIAKHGAIAVVKAVTAGLVDVTSVTDGLARGLSEGAKQLGDGLTGDLIDAFKRERASADRFRTLLTELVQYVRKCQDLDKYAEPRPVVLMIDELDRCRPTFAIAMLERIKHFFRVPGLVFVLAMDLEQLRASTRKVYGAELDAIEYLRRFIDLELKLPRAKVGLMVNAMLSNCGADTFFKARESYPKVRDDRRWIVRILQSLGKYYDLSPRLIQRMVSRLMLVIKQTATNAYLDPILVVFMIFLRVRHERLLEDYVNNQAEVSDIFSTLTSSTHVEGDFFDTHNGHVVAAHLFYAQKVGRTTMESFLSKQLSQEWSPSTPEEHRMYSVARIYDNVQRQSWDRTGMDLSLLYQRINLIGDDLVDED